MADWNSEEDWRDGLAEGPSIYTNGQEVGKTPQRKNTRPSSIRFLFRFLPSETRTKHPAHSRKNVGGSDPVRTFGRQNRTNTRVAPANIEVFACSLFADSFCLIRLYGEPLSRRAAEREAYVSTRTLRVVQCSVGLNHMRGGRASIQQWNRRVLASRQMAYQNPRVR